MLCQCFLLQNFIVLMFCLAGRSFWYDPQSFAVSLLATDCPAGVAIHVAKIRHFHVDLLTCRGLRRDRADATETVGIFVLSSVFWLETGKI